MQIYDVEQEVDRDPPRPPPPPPRDPAALAIYDVTIEEPTDASWPPFVAASPATRRLFVADVEGALIEDPAALAPAAAPGHEPATDAVPTAATESGASDGADVHVH